MGIEKVGMAFHEYCVSNKILKVLLPLSMPVLLVTAALGFIQDFVSLGSVLGALIYVGFFLGILLTFAKSEYRILSIGLCIHAAGYVFGIVKLLIKYHSLSWSSLIYILAWGFFAYMAYKKSIKMAA